jgi:hypothetical protein
MLTYAKGVGCLMGQHLGLAFFQKVWKWFEKAFGEGLFGVIFTLVEKSGAP